MENLNVFKEKVTELYHSLIGFNLIELSNKHRFDNNQLYEIACNAVSSEDEYFMKWLTKNQGIFDHKDGLPSTDDKPTPSSRLSILLMKEVLLYGNITVKVDGYDKQPITMIARQFMKDEGWVFEDPLFDYLLDKIVELREFGHIESPYLTLVSYNDKKTLIALDVFCKGYYTCFGSLLYPGLITGSNFSPSLSDEEKKKKTGFIEHLFLDMKMDKLENRQKGIKNELRELKGSDPKCKDLLKEYQENQSKRDEIWKKIRQDFNGRLIYK